MSLLSKLPRPFRAPTLTRGRIAFAVSVAVIADALQFALGPFGFLFLDEVIDVIALVLASLAIGPHVLLLPTFIIECIPLVDLVPTWTACVAMVIAQRRKQPSDISVVPSAAPPVIEVKSK